MFHQSVLGGGCEPGMTSSGFPCQSNLDASGAQCLKKALVRGPEDGPREESNPSRQGLHHLAEQHHLPQQCSDRLHSVVLLAIASMCVDAASPASPPQSRQIEEVGGVRRIRTNPASADTARACLRYRTQEMPHVPVSPSSTAMAATLASAWSSDQACAEARKAQHVCGHVVYREPSKTTSGRGSRRSRPNKGQPGQHGQCECPSVL